MNGEFIMNKKELISAIAEKSGASKKDAEKFLNSTVDVITEALAKGDNVALVGLGSFVVRERAEREGKNPQTGEKIKIAACKAAGFKPSKVLKDAINQ